MARAPHRTARSPGPPGVERAHGDDEHPRRRCHAGAAGRVHRRARGPRARPPRRSPVCSTPCSSAATLVPLADDAARSSRRPRRAPAATAAIRSTCRRSRRSSSPGPGCRCASTGAGRRRRSAARPTCSRRSGCGSSSAPSGVARCVEHAGIGFCFAQAYHPSFRFAGSSRREIGIPTVFNLLGPMANPGRVRRQVIGVANPAVAERMVTTLRAHGSVRAWVVHGGGLDELTTVGAVDRARTGRRRRPRRSPSTRPSSASPGPCPRSSRAARRRSNAEFARRVLDGDHGPHRDIIVLNAGAGLVVGGVAEDLHAGIAVAAGEHRHAARRPLPLAGARRRRRTHDRPGSRIVGQPRARVRRARAGGRSVRRGRHRPTNRRERARSADEHHPAMMAFRLAGGDRFAVGADRSPMGRGLGYSGAVRVAGRGCRPRPARRRPRGRRRRTGRRGPRLGTELEGHADNVAASLFGGVVVTAGGRVASGSRSASGRRSWCGSRRSRPRPMPRGRLPAPVPFADAAFNVGRAALLVAALAAGRIDAPARGDGGPAAPGSPASGRRAVGARARARRSPPAHGVRGSPGPGRRSPARAARARPSGCPRRARLPAGSIEPAPRGRLTRELDGRHAPGGRADEPLRGPRRSRLGVASAMRPPARVAHQPAGDGPASARSAGSSTSARQAGVAGSDSDGGKGAARRRCRASTSRPRSTHRRAIDLEVEASRRRARPDRPGRDGRRRRPAQRSRVRAASSKRSAAARAASAVEHRATATVVQQDPPGRRDDGVRP